MNQALLQLEEPKDYFKGVGAAGLPTPTDILVFLRAEKNKLQHEALQNRSHHRFVLIFNLETPGHVHLDNLVLPFKPGEALLVLPFQFHHFSQLGSDRLKWLFCTFELEPQTFLEPLRNRVVGVEEKTRRVLEELLKEWHLPSSELQAKQLQVVLLRLLLSLKQDRLSSATDLPPEPKDNLLRSVNRLMAEWRGRTVVVADLAEALGFSESRLHVLFKEAAGIPLGGYIQNYRISRAMALLRTTGYPVSYIAEEAGFGSPQAFSRIFKKSTGQTPRAYRKSR
ncbi:MAG: helix-turn-helix transcriptional regulator [Verrucomicrobiota bacterium]